MPEIIIHQAIPEDAKLLTDLAYTTFWDAFSHHPKNAPDDLNHYMRQAFNQEQINAELSDANNIFLIAEIEGEAAGYSKIIIDNIEPGITAEKASRAFTSLLAPKTSRPGRRTNVDGRMLRTCTHRRPRRHVAWRLGIQPKSSTVL